MKLSQYIKFFFIFACLVSISSCQKIKDIIKPPPKDIIQKSYTVRLYGYKSSVFIKTSPENLINYLVKDLSWTNKFTGIMQFKVQDLKSDLDMTRVGQSVGVISRVLGFNLPLRVVNIKYIPDKEIWLMVFVSGDSWLLARIEAKAKSDGCIVSLDATGYVSPSLSRMMDSFQISKIAASTIDLAMAMVQAEFDPEIDPKKLTEKGLRGELYEKFLQAYEASVWLNVPPDKAISRGMNPDTLKEIIETSQSQGSSECLYQPDNRLKWDTKTPSGKIREVIYCPDTTIKVAGINWEIDSFVRVNPYNAEDFLKTCAVNGSIFTIMDIYGMPEKSGTQLFIRLFLEPPGPAAPNLTELFISFSGVPDWMRNMLLTIKAKAEEVG